MTSVGEVIAGLRGVLDQLGGARQRTEVAGASWGLAASGYQVTTAGSGQPEARELAALGEAASHQIREAEGLVARCESTVRAIVDRLAGVGSPAATSTGGPGGEPRQPAHRQHAGVVRQELQRIGRTGYGAGTRGSWINDDGSAEPIVSGTGTPWYRRTRAVLAGLGRRNTALDTHCEAQAVVRMQQERLQRATIVLSRSPCGADEMPGRPYTCDRRLGEIIRRLLPAGATLTVIDPDEKVWIYPKEVEE